MSRNPPTDEKPPRGARRGGWSAIVALATVLYLLSSGPVIAAGFWLREATGWGAFYAVMWLYFPVLLFPPNSVPIEYVEWWVELLGTHGPG